MNKDTKYIPIDPVLEDWLINKLKSDAPECENADKLLSGILNMKEGNIRSLLLCSSEQDASAENTAHGNIKTGELEIYLKSRRVLLSGSEIGLTPKEFDILYFLAENRGEVFTKEQIYNAVWSDEYMLDDSNIMAFIRKLRKKIEPDPDAPKYILTIWGIGYKFNDQL